MPNVEIKYMTSLEITLQRNDKECHEKHKSPMFFGKTLDYRFDSASSECGVLYASPELASAFDRNLKWNHDSPVLTGTGDSLFAGNG